MSKPEEEPTPDEEMKEAETIWSEIYRAVVEWRKRLRRKSGES